MEHWNSYADLDVNAHSAGDSRRMPARWREASGPLRTCAAALLLSPAEPVLSRLNPGRTVDAMISDITDKASIISNFHDELLLFAINPPLLPWRI